MPKFDFLEMLQNMVGTPGVQVVVELEEFTSY